MKDIRIILKNNILLRSIPILALIFMVNISSMYMTPKTKALLKSGKLNPMRQRQNINQLQEVEEKEGVVSGVSAADFDLSNPSLLFIHELNDESKGIWVDKEFLKNNVPVIAIMIEDVGGELNEIPLKFPIDAIKLGFDVLSGRVSVNKLSVAELISVANMLNFLDVKITQDKMKLVLEKVKKDIVDKSDEESVNEQLKQLNLDLQIMLMVNPTIDYLKNFIIKTFMGGYFNKRRVSHRFIGAATTNALAFNPDGTKILVGRSIKYSGKNLLLWDVSDLSELRRELLYFDVPAYNITAVASNPISNIFVSGDGGSQESLIFWDINNPKNIIRKVIAANIPIASLVFSPDGKDLIVGCSRNQDNLILYHLGDLNNISNHLLDGHPKNITSVSFSPDGTKIISGCEGNENNLILWDISDRDNIISETLNCTSSVKSVAFSPSGDTFISAGEGHHNNIMLWNMSDLKANHVIIDNLSSINISKLYVMVLSHDGKRIALGHDNGFVIYDINDSQYITQVNTPDAVISLAFSPSDKKIVSGRVVPELLHSDNEPALWILLSDKEEALLNALKKDYNADQIRLIYTFCLKALKGESISLKSGSEEYNIFMTLPKDMQKLLKDLFFSWLSSWW